MTCDLKYSKELVEECELLIGERTAVSYDKFAALIDEIERLTAESQEQNILQIQLSQAIIAGIRQERLELKEENKILREALQKISKYESTNDDTFDFRMTKVIASVALLNGGKSG
jgi:uncharacterized protein YdcH (DUF465 family)